MGLFDFFSRKKKERDYSEDIDRVFDDERHTSGPLNKTDFHRPEMRQHFVFDKCEEMMEYSHQLDDAKLEYESVTAYLMDIDVIENLPPEQRAEINEMALKISELEKDRKEYQEYSNKLSDVRFSGIRMYEDEFPDNIERLKENEKYKALVKRDIDAIQGEKSNINLSIEDAKKSNKSLRKWAFFIPIIFALLLTGTFLLKYMLYWDVTTLLCVDIFIACAAGAGVLLKNQKNNNTIRQGTINLNHAIVLMNRAKSRFVSITNAVDYVYDKFNIHSSYELEYLWDEYSDLKKERGRHSLATDDLDYYCNKLSHQLAKYNINDPVIWGGQVKALIDHKEMVEIRHDLNTRRQKLRSRIEFNSNEAERVKAEIMDVVKTYPQYSEEILDMVKSIDSKRVI
ncbi:MAG: hypothetical protein IK152_05780 [Lachnospiraceae bacterium]|nr:hypothetical protein [Lachnospiraceae bacterium]